VCGEELTKNHIKLVVAAQMDQGIMLNTVRKSQGISFLKLTGSVLFRATNCMVGDVCG